MKAFPTLIFLCSLLWFSLRGCRTQKVSPLRVGLELISEGFTSPVALIDPQDGSQRLFVVDQTGLIWILSQGDRSQPPF